MLRLVGNVEIYCPGYRAAPAPSSVARGAWPGQVAVERIAQ
jgi:hypothetical protein